MLLTRHANLLRSFFWPVLAAFACAAIWWITISRANAEWDRANATLTKDAGAYAEAYEQYITRSVGQMDQVTMQLKHSWEHTRSPTLIEDLKRDGMFTDSAYAAVSVVDRDGNVRSSTHEIMGAPNLAHTRFFAHHKNNISTALRIGVTPGELAYHPEVVLFTRRLDTADDEFDGVVLLAVDARYFTSFVGPATLGKHGIVALVGSEDRLRIEQHGDGALAAVHPSAILPPGATWRSSSGVQLVAADGGFADGIARVLGWRHSTAYPLVALVGLSYHEAVAGAQLYWRESRNTAILANACLMLLGTLAAVFSTRAAARRREQDEVRSAYRTATESANQAIVSMARALEMAVVAEGVETEEQLAILQALDCNEVQGYFIARPMPADDMFVMMERRFLFKSIETVSS